MLSYPKAKKQLRRFSMKIEDMIRGESKNIEFKEILPSNSEKYTKTIIAFANTQGGKLIIGVADRLRSKG